MEKEEKEKRKKEDKKNEVFYYIFIFPRLPFPPSQESKKVNKKEAQDPERILMNFISMISGFPLHSFYFSFSVQKRMRTGRRLRWAGLRRKGCGGEGC